MEGILYIRKVNPLASGDSPRDKDNEAYDVNQRIGKSIINRYLPNDVMLLIDLKLLVKEIFTFMEQN